MAPASNHCHEHAKSTSRLQQRCPARGARCPSCTPHACAPKVPSPLPTARHRKPAAPPTVRSSQRGYSRVQNAASKCPCLPATPNSSIARASSLGNAAAAQMQEPEQITGSRVDGLQGEDVQEKRHCIGTRVSFDEEVRAPHPLRNRAPKLWQGRRLPVMHAVALVTGHHRLEDGQPAYQS